MSGLSTESVLAAGRRQLGESTPLQRGLGVLAVVAMLATIPLAGERPVLIAITAVTVALIAFDRSMRRRPGALDESLVRAQVELLAGLTEELQLESEGWYLPTEEATIRHWYPSADRPTTLPEPPVSAVTLNQGDAAGLYAPTIGTSILEQPNVPSADRPVAPRRATRLTIDGCSERTLVGEASIESTERVQEGRLRTELVVTAPSGRPSDEWQFVLESVLGAGVADLTGAPVQITTDCGRDADQLELAVTVAGERPD